MTMSQAEKKVKWMKTAKVIYWTETLLFCFFMLSGGIMMLAGAEQNIKGIVDLGYPAYLCKILGIAKILGVTAILFGKPRILKEWAYAGFTFLLLGASASHIFHGDPLWRILMPLGLLILALLSRRQWKTGWM
jgi:hypothetical protein